MSRDALTPPDSANHWEIVRVPGRRGGCIFKVVATGLAFKAAQDELQTLNDRGGVYMMRWRGSGSPYPR